MNAETLQAFAERSLSKVGNLEYAGPCPLCGGNDRFHVSFKRSPYGYAYCRQGCTDGEWWSAVWFTSKVYGISYREARKLYGMAEGETSPRLSETERQAERAQALENSLSLCKQNWSEQAAQVLARFQRGLYDSQAAAYLRDERKLTGKTCQKLGFGYCTAFEKIPAWYGKKGEIYNFPDGVVLPIMRGGFVVGFTIRREKPWKAPDGREVRYYDIYGGPKVPFLCGPSDGIVVVVEGIIDAASVFQASRGKFGVIAVSGNNMPLDAAARDMLTAAKVVLVIQDADSAGAELAKLVRAVRPNATAASVPDGKDANGYLVAHDDDMLARWLIDMAKRSIANEKAKAASVKENPVSLPASKNEKTKYEKAQENLSPLLDPSNSVFVCMDASTELDGMQPLTDITTSHSAKTSYASPLSCLMSLYSGVRLLAYPDGRVIVRDPQGRDSLTQYVKTYQKKIWQELTSGAAS